MGIQGTLRLRCPAKITPYLKILGIRPDRYHAVRLLLLPIDLFDTIDITGSDTEGISLDVQGQDWQGDPRENLVWQAAQRFAEASGQAPRWALRLDKRIPSGAGLGGGSSDAAATLVALNRLTATPLPPARLHALAAALGSDVPFFLDPAPALAEGRGERLSPFPHPPPTPLLLVKPGFAIATGAAYAAVAARGYGPDPGALPPAVSADWTTALHNDFEPALLPQHPELGRIKQALIAAGAQGALLSGSGSAVFGVFGSVAARDRGAADLRPEPGWRVIPCQTLGRVDPFAEEA